MAASVKPGKTSVVPLSETGTRKLMRLHFELALELGVAGRRPLRETLDTAVATAGCDIALQLPTRDAAAVLTVVRLREAGRDAYLQIRVTETGFDVADEADIDADLLGFARASIDVLERLKAGRSGLEPHSYAAH